MRPDLWPGLRADGQRRLDRGDHPHHRDLELIREQMARAFRKKNDDVFQQNLALLQLGYAWAEAELDFRVEVPPAPGRGPLVVMNGNEALGMGAIAAGMELCAMYPITPATSVSHT